jgi:hypothetical protein
MNLLAACCLALGAVCLLELVWAAAEALPEELDAARGERVEDLLAQHARHYPQLRQVLAALDADYLRRKASGEIERHLQQERRRIVESFLPGLAEDIGRLERMMTMVRKMSPAEPWLRQLQRTGRRFHFRVNYRIASLEIRSSRLQSTVRLARLTELLGNLSAQIEVSMGQLAASAAVHAPQTGRRSRIETD